MWKWVAPGRKESTCHDLGAIDALNILVARNAALMLLRGERRSCRRFTHLRRHMQQPERRNWGVGEHGGTSSMEWKEGLAVSSPEAFQWRGLRLTRGVL